MQRITSRTGHLTLRARQLTRTTRQFTRTTREGGFTLIELMVVITILGLLAGITSVALLPRLAEARIDTSKGAFRGVMEGIDLYRIRKGRLPESIQQLVDEEYLKGKTEPVDSWGNKFQYSRIDKKNYDLLSLGADGVEGGEGEDADITMDNINAQPESESE